jgi:hypothetical protein
VVTGRNGPNVRQVIQGDLAGLPDERARDGRAYREAPGAGERGSRETRTARREESEGA